MIMAITRRVLLPFAAGLAIVGLCTTQAAAGPAPDAIQAGYSTATLREPLFDAARVAVEVPALNNWLNLNRENLSQQQMRGPREHLFYLIDSRVKQLYESTGAVMPAEPDAQLQTLFSWAERLGVFGGALVYDSLRRPDAPPGVTLRPVPETLSLELNGDAFELASAVGDWSVAFPYYFMVWRLDDFDAKSGMRTQLAGISTGTARHEGVEGYSQATLLLMFSPGADHAAFSSYWTTQFGVADQLPAGTTDLAKLKTRVLYDPATHLHSEAVLWQTPQGSFALIYSGIDGTYQWNRAHFLDFFRSVSTPAERAGNASSTLD